jgi:signal transduction histidine kinase
MLEMVLPEDILQTNRQILELANINCSRMKRMIDSLLDMARLDAGESQLSLVPLDLPSLIKRAIERMVPMAQSKSLALQAIFPAEELLIEADEEKIDRVLDNLIENAIKFTPSAGQITIAIEFQAEQVLVSVTNGGSVIRLEDRERIFDRFAQSAGTSISARGSGLGLAFCRLAVEAHGGRIWVEPGDGGEGNRFIFRLPRSIQG